MTSTKVNRVSLTARVIPTLKQALETESREHGQTTSNYVESILLKRGEIISDSKVVDSTKLLEQLEELQAENTALKEKLETYIPESDLTAERENAVYREQKYQARIDELTEHIERLSDNQERIFLAEECDRLILEKSNLEVDNEALQAKVERLAEQLERVIQYNKEKGDLHLKFVQLQETEKFLRINNDDLQSQVQKLTEEVSITEQALEEITEINQKLADTYEVKIEELSDELSAFRNVGFDVQELKLVEEENDELHERVDALEMQLIEQQEAHEVALQALEEEEPIDPAYVESLESSLADHKEKIAELEDSLTVAEDEVYLDFTAGQHLEFKEHLTKLHAVYEGHTDEELVLGALFSGVKNESAFLRKLVGDYFEG